MDIFLSKIFVGLPKVIGEIIGKRHCKTVWEKGEILI